MPSMARPSTAKVAPEWAKEEDAMDDADGELERCGRGQRSGSAGRMFEEGDAVFEGIEPRGEPG